MKNVILLPAEAADIDLLTRLHQEAFEEAREMYGQGPPGYADPSWHSETLKAHSYFKILVDDQLVGGVIVHQQGAGECFLHTIFVRPSNHNMGIGTAIMALVEHHFPDAARWTLLTPYRDFRNHHFYEKLGYRRVDQIRVTEEGLEPNFTLFKYEKRVRS
jgi:GNAT superfamily N-acetyltransferase